MDLRKEELSKGVKDKRRKRWIKQRIKRGYSDRDVWSFDSFLAEVIAGGVRQIARFSGYKTEDEKKYRDDLNFIADQFERYANEQFIFNPDFQEFIEDDFHKAWILFEDHFGGLWI